MGLMHSVLVVPNGRAAKSRGVWMETDEICDDNKHIWRGNFDDFDDG